MEGRTTFVITHKIANAASADKILVMNEGSLVESGSHKELLEQGGIYSLWAKQQLFKDISKYA